MKRQEYKLLVENWNKFLLKEEKEVFFEEYLLSESFDKKTISLFTLGALSTLALNFVDIQHAEARSNKPEVSSSQNKVVDNNEIVDDLEIPEATLNDMDEIARAVILLNSQNGVNFDGGSEDQTRKVLKRPLTSKFGKELASEYLDHVHFVVGSFDTEKAMNSALEAAKKDGAKKVSIEHVKQITSTRSKFSGHKELEKLIEVNTEIFAKTYSKIKERISKIKISSKKGKTLLNSENKELDSDKMVELLDSVSKAFKSKGFNSNNVKAFALILMGVDIETSEIVDVLKTINNNSYGSRLDPAIQRVLSHFSMIIDFSTMNESMKKRAAIEIFSSQDGCDAYSALRSIYGMGFKFMKKATKAIQDVKMSTKVHTTHDRASASGNPKFHTQGS